MPSSSKPPWQRTPSGDQRLGDRRGRRAARLSVKVTWRSSCRSPRASCRATVYSCVYTQGQIAVETQPRAADASERSAGLDPARARPPPSPGAGFAATSMDDVAAASGITKLIVYRHFDSKEELYRADPAAGVRPARRRSWSRPRAPRDAGLGARTLLTVAREDPAAFMLLWRHAPPGAAVRSVRPRAPLDVRRQRCGT